MKHTFVASQAALAVALCCLVGCTGDAPVASVAPSSPEPTAIVPVAPAPLAKTADAKPTDDAVAFVSLKVPNMH